MRGSYRPLAGMGRFGPTPTNWIACPAYGPAHGVGLTNRSWHSSPNPNPAKSIDTRESSVILRQLVAAEGQPIQAVLFGGIMVGRRKSSSGFSSTCWVAGTF